MLYKLSPGRDGGFPTITPTDPDVTDSVIRFLGNQSLGTTLTHNFAAPQTVLDVVDDPGFRKRPALTKRFKLLPVDVTLVTATAQPIPPRMFTVLEDDRKHFEVAPNSIVLIVATQFLAQNSVLLLERHVPVPAAPLPQ